MNINDLFPGNFLKAGDFPAPRQVIIRLIKVEKVGDDDKPVLYFNYENGAEEPRGVVLNKTNANRIVENLITRGWPRAAAEDPTKWTGQTVVFAQERTEFQGRMVDSIRVQFDPHPGATQAAPAVAPPAGLAPPQAAPQPAAQPAWAQPGTPAPPLGQPTMVANQQGYTPPAPTAAPVQPVPGQPVPGVPNDEVPF